eukprot:3547943-Alexandrium_andersonii.AAC.1
MDVSTGCAASFVRVCSLHAGGGGRAIWWQGAAWWGVWLWLWPAWGGVVEGFGVAFARRCSSAHEDSFWRRGW